MSTTKPLPVPPPKPRSSFLNTTTAPGSETNNNNQEDSPTINATRSQQNTTSSRSYTLRPNAPPPTAIINSIINNKKNTNSSPSSPTTNINNNNSNNSCENNARVGGNNSPSSPGGSRKPPPPLPPRPAIRSKTIASVNSPSERSTGGGIQFASVIGNSNNNIGRSSVGNQIDESSLSVTSGSSLSMNVGKGISNNSNSATSSFVKSTLNIGSKIFSNKSKDKTQSPQVLTILHKIPPPKPESATNSATTPVNNTPTKTEEKDDENDIATKSAPTHSFKLDLDRVLTPTQEESTNPPSSAHSEKLSTCDESDDESDEEEDGSIKSYNRSVKSAPPPIPQKKIKTAEEKEIERRELRWEVIAEITKTEENYVEGMNHLERFYIKPLKALGNATQISGAKQVITQKDLSFIFDKMTVIKSVNEGFLKQWKTLDVTFETQDDPTKSIGLFFKRTMPMFKVYTDYVNNYNNIASKVKDMMKENPGFDSYMNEMERNARKQGKVGFFSYMIQPVQRLPRYTLLLNELLKHTPETHFDVKNINEALELSKQVSSHVNSAMNVLQNQMKMNEIDTTIGKLHENLGGSIIKPSRCFIMEGEDFLVSEIVLGRKIKKGVKRTLILLNDMVLITKKGKYSCHINFKNELNVENFKYPWIYFDLDNDKQSFEIVADDITYLITCPTAIACNEWIDKLSQNTSCNSGPVKEFRANKLVHPRVKKIFNEQNVYIIDFENSEYYMCYSQRDKVTIKIPKKDAIVRDIVPEDEVIFGSLVLDDDASCDDSKTTASSDTADTASSQMIDGNRMSRSTSISDLSSVSEDGSSLKSPRSARGFNPLKALNMVDIKLFNGKKQSPSNSKNSLSSEDKVKNIHSSLSEIASAGTSGEMPPPSNRFSLQNDQHTKSSSPFFNKNRQSLSSFEQTNSGENSPANPDEFMGNQIARRTSDFQQTIEERKKTLIRREPPPVPQSNTTTQQQKAPWLAELESKRLTKVSKQEEEQ